MIRFRISVTAILLSVVTLTTLTACGVNEMNAPALTRLPSLNDIPREDWARLERKRIFFGHQSVGYNIVEGVRELAEGKGPIALKILETTNPGDFSTPLFAHAAIGKNGDPRSKCEAFSNILDKQLQGKVDIALFKFCYVDITGATALEQTMTDYESLIERLKRKFPKIVFIHVTVPLNTTPMDLRSRVKRFIGYPQWVDTDNMKRDEFNRMLRDRYLGKEPVFDLAAVESIRPDGRRSTFRRNGRTYDSLTPEYTDDGEHLNPLGRKRAAEQLLITLAGAAKRD